MGLSGIRTGAMLGAILALAVISAMISGGHASAQVYGFATLPPGSLNHTSASAISKVVKEKGGINMLVQPTAGESVLVPMVARGEASAWSRPTRRSAAWRGGSRWRFSPPSSSGADA